MQKATQAKLHPANPGLGLHTAGATATDPQEALNKIRINFKSSERGGGVRIR